MRLIDAEHLKRWILARWEKTDPRSAYPLRAIDIIDQVDREDTIDAVPVRHGKWIEMSDADGHYYACSECGEELYREWSFDREFDIFPKKKSIDKTQYCPTCGAMMK